jgi:hypothetical protein
LRTLRWGVETTDGDIIIPERLHRQLYEIYKAGFIAGFSDL